MVKVARSAAGNPGFGSRVQTWHRSSGHIEAASHIPQLKGPATKIYNCVQGGFGEIKLGKKKKDWQQLLAQVSILKEKKEEWQQLLAQAPI